MTPEWPHPEDAVDFDPISDTLNDSQLRELAVTVAANVPCGTIEELLDNADKVQKYLATGQRDEADETAAQPL